MALGLALSLLLASPVEADPVFTEPGFTAEVIQTAGSWFASGGGLHIDPETREVYLPFSWGCTDDGCSSISLRNFWGQMTSVKFGVTNQTCPFVYDEALSTLYVPGRAYLGYVVNRVKAPPGYSDTLRYFYGEGPPAMASVGDGRLYAVMANNSDDLLEIIPPAPYTFDEATVRTKCAGIGRGTALAREPSGTYLMATETGNGQDAIVRINPDTCEVSTLTGSLGYLDCGLAVHPTTGDIYAARYYDSVPSILRVDPETGSTSVFATNVSCTTGMLFGPSMDRRGTSLYVRDYTMSWVTTRVYEIKGFGLSPGYVAAYLYPESATLSPGQSIVFTVDGGSPPYSFRASSGVLSDQGPSRVTYTAGGSLGDFSLTARDSAGIERTATVRVVPVRVAPEKSVFAPGASGTFRAEAGAPPYNWSATGGTPPAGTGQTFQYTAGGTERTFAVSVEDSLGATASAEVVIRSNVGRAIVVAGGGTGDNPILQETEWLGDLAYRVLVKRGFTRDQIYYLTSDPTRPFDGDGDGDLTNDIDALAGTANLQYALTDWAVNSGIGPGVPLFVYLVDHGLVDKFVINRQDGTSEEIAAQTMKQWLDSFQNATGAPVVFAYDACYAGSFVGDLSRATPDRVLIASAAADQRAFYNRSGEISFSYGFLMGLRIGDTFYDAYERASALVNAFFGQLQSPQIEDSGDGVANRVEDGSKAKGYLLGQDVGTGSQAAAMADAAGTEDPVLSEPGPLNAQISSGDEVEFSIRVASPSPPSSVKATLVPPDYDAVAGTGAPVEVALSPSVSDPTLYKGRTNAMGAAGVWWVTFTAESTPGSTAFPVTTNVEVVAGKRCGAMAPSDPPSFPLLLVTLSPLTLPWVVLCRYSRRRRAGSR